MRDVREQHRQKPLTICSVVDQGGQRPTSPHEQRCVVGGGDDRSRVLHTSLESVTGTAPQSDALVTIDRDNVSLAHKSVCLCEAKLEGQISR